MWVDSLSGDFPYESKHSNTPSLTIKNAIQCEPGALAGSIFTINPTDFF